MAKITVFNFITLNGFFKGINHDISWHRHGAEESKYSQEMLAENNLLLFGRTTFEMMAGFWPTPMAIEQDPIVAKGMNDAEKIVFSKTLKETDWSNSTIVNDNLITYTKQLKENSPKNIALLGSGSVLTQFAEHNLIDEYQIMIDPIAIGAGTPILNGVKQPLPLELIATKIFKSSTVLLYYKPAKQ